MNISARARAHGLCGSHCADSYNAAHTFRIITRNSYNVCPALWPGCTLLGKDINHNGRRDARSGLARKSFGKFNNAASCDARRDLPLRNFAGQAATIIRASGFAAEQQPKASSSGRFFFSSASSSSSSERPASTIASIRPSPTSPLLPLSLSLSNGTMQC